MRWLRAYVRFWGRREGAESLALIRAGIGLVILFDLAQVMRFGLVSTLWAPVEAGGLGPSTRAAPLVSFYHWFGASAVSAHVLFVLMALCASGVCLGLCTRASALGLLFCSGQLEHLSPDASRGIDALLRNALAVLVCSGAGATWSLDALVRHGKFNARAQIPAWPRYLLIAQLIVLYFWAGMLKQGPEWTRLGGYSALFRVLSAPDYARNAFTPAQLLAAYPVLQLATFVTLVFERSAALLPLLLWWRRNPARGGVPGRIARHGRLLELWVTTGVLFHLSLAALTKLGIFPWGCLALYPALVRPRTLRSAVTRLRDLCGFKDRALSR